MYPVPFSHAQLCGPLKGWINTMNVEELIDELYEMVEKAWNLPLSRGRAVLDGEEVKQILDEIRENLPQELLKAKAIVADRNQIISTAKMEAEKIGRAHV